MRTSTTGRLQTSMNLVDDDDGWGDVKVDTNDSIPDVTSSSSPSDKILQNKELARLQDDMARKQIRQFQSSGANNGERDLFIPIVSVTAAVGFASLYGYEILRLYSRGELYLPWEQ